MTVLDLLAHLRDRGVELFPEGENRLRYRAPKGVLTAELKAEIATQKGDILQALDDQQQAKREQDEAVVPLLVSSRVVARGIYGLEILEVEPVDPPGPLRWERRAVHGAVALVTDSTDNKALAESWCRSVRSAARREVQESIDEWSPSD